MDGSSPMPVVPAADGERSPADEPELETTLRAFADLAYRDRYWPGRRYEDRCDRIALRAMLPRHGVRLIEVGAGFGRLADEYAGFAEVVLLDPSEAMLRGAREQVGDDPRFRLVLGEASRIPFPDESFDAVVCIRVLHHVRDPAPAIEEFARVLRPGGVLVMEVANKRNLKAVLAFTLRRQRSSPFRRGSDPNMNVTLVPERHTPARAGGGAGPGPAAAGSRWGSSTAWLHAPADVVRWVRAAGLEVDATRSVGLLRPPLLTGHLPTRLLVVLERLLQPGLARLTPGPSLFVRAARHAAPDASGGRR